MVARKRRAVDFPEIRSVRTDRVDVNARFQPFGFQNRFFSGSDSDEKIGITHDGFRVVSDFDHAIQLRRHVLLDCGGAGCRWTVEPDALDLAYAAQGLDVCASLNARAQDSKHRSLRVSECLGGHCRGTGGANSSNVAPVHDRDNFTRIGTEEHDCGENCGKIEFRVLLKISDDFHSQGFVVA